jgi:hypothetical protein
MGENYGDRERQLSRDRETIRNWADRHDVVPVREGSDEVRMVPEERVEGSDQRLEWDRFFEAFEVQDHEEVVTDLDDDEVEEQLLKGETVTSTVTETAVVESVVTEELTVESELVDTEMVDHAVVDLDLVDREVTNCEVIEDEPATGEEWFDKDRYLDAVGRETESAPGGGPTTFDEGDLPYHSEVDVEETWTVTRDVTEEFIVETEITDAEVTEAESLEDYDIDVEGLHRTIADSGIIEEDLSTEEFLAEHDAESELVDDDRVTTRFTRHRTVQDELVDRKQLRGDLGGGEVQDMELVRTEDVVPEGEAVAAGQETDIDETATAGETGMEAGTVGGPDLTEDDVGKTVVDPTGDEIGTVTDVDEGANAMYVDPEAGLTERLKSALGWGGADEGDRRLDASHVADVTDDEVRLEHREDLNAGGR